MHKTDRKPAFPGVQKAYEKLRAQLPETPLLQLEAGIFCKCESDQPIGAFKLRGAWHRLTDLTPAERAAGVVAFSSGNHAQGVAWAADQLGISAAIVMPSDAPGLKIEGTRRLGAEVIFYDRATESREDIARALAEARGAVLVPSFDDPWVIEGQGSAGLEIIAQLGRQPDLIITPCGGGGLAAGLALACPESRIAIVEPDGWDDMGVSLARGEIVPIGSNPPPTLCDALQTPRVSPLTFDVLRSRRAAAFSVTEDETSAAMIHAHRHLGKVIEPGGAVGLAALLAKKITPARTTVILLSGGNVDPALFSRVTGL